MPHMNVHYIFLKNTTLCKTGYTHTVYITRDYLKCQAVLLPVTHGQLKRNYMIICARIMIMKQRLVCWTQEPLL